MAIDRRSSAPNQGLAGIRTAYKGSDMTNGAGNFACIDPGFKHGGDHDFDEDDDGRGDDRH
ncbi:hypothetical protein JJB99_21145 [Bradyrhizobium diazoefficiens]|uniref:hypothetical protein n=1 Tax=Bradyrhizobium diazoefficiens TaxID=1355477 RepID=UPI00190C154A|nr:hypothetical protein [Bradyrhizobium diazoefficiens]QQO18394.1 hypothetical protein JJB99_21145 [Bradyrhizobium diazoefficiens]